MNSGRGGAFCCLSLIPWATPAWDILGTQQTSDDWRNDRLEQLTVHQELKRNNMTHIGDCISPSVSSCWLEQEVWWSVKSEMRYDYKERANANASIRKEVFWDALMTRGLITWISRIFFQAQLEDGMLIATVIMITYYVLSADYGQAKHSPSQHCLQRVLVIPLHRGRHWQIRASQGHRPNWQEYFQFWLSKTSFHTSLCSSNQHTTLISYNLQGIRFIDSFFWWKAFVSVLSKLTQGAKPRRKPTATERSAFSWCRPGRNLTVTGKKRPDTSIYFMLPPEIEVLSKVRGWTRGRDGDKGG